MVPVDTDGNCQLPRDARISSTNLTDGAGRAAGFSVPEISDWSLLFVDDFEARGVLLHDLFFSAIVTLATVRRDGNLQPPQWSTPRNES